jgi:hypothetical protein
MEKIAAYEASVMQEIRNHSVDIAIDTVRSIIEEHMQADIAEELVTKAVSDVSKKLH